MISRVLFQEDCAMAIAIQPYNFLYKPNTLTQPLNHTASFLACVFAIYSTSVVESATTTYLLLIQLISLPNRLNTHPLVDLL